MQIALTIQCRVNLRVTLVQKGITVVASAKMVVPLLKRHLMWDITNFSWSALFPSHHEILATDCGYRLENLVPP